MTDLDVSRLIAKVDALQVAYFSNELSKFALSDGLRSELKRILDQTVASTHRQYTDLFSVSENRSAYYDSFMRHLRRIGFLELAGDDDGIYGFRDGGGGGGAGGGGGGSGNGGRGGTPWNR